MAGSNIGINKKLKILLFLVVFILIMSSAYAIWCCDDDDNDGYLGGVPKSWPVLNCQNAGDGDQEKPCSEIDTCVRVGLEWDCPRECNLPCDNHATCHELTPAADDSICDGYDNDCDGQIDEDCKWCCDDDDGDGYLGSTTTAFRSACSSTGSGLETPCRQVTSIYGGGCSGGTWATEPNCHFECSNSIDGRTMPQLDEDISSYPSATEECDGKDNNCNNDIDEGCITCQDEDSCASPDQVGCSDENTRYYCEVQIDGCYDNITVDCVGTDFCSDGNCVPLTGQELCDGIDNDDNGQTDEGFHEEYSTDGFGCCIGLGIPGVAHQENPIYSIYNSTAYYEECCPDADQCVYDGKCYDKGSNLYFEPKPAPDTDYLYLAKSCGENNDWQEMELKYRWDRYIHGYCNKTTECLVRPRCFNDPLVEEPYYCNLDSLPIDSLPPRCIADGAYLGDHYCEDGNWTSRTKLVAVQLLNLTENLNDYTLFCDNYQNVLNYFDYGIGVNSIDNYYILGKRTWLDSPICDVQGPIAIAEQDERSYSEEVEPCVNNFCVLKYTNPINGDEIVALGTSLNKIEDRTAGKDVSLNLSEYIDVDHWYVDEFLEALGESTTLCDGSGSKSIDGGFNQCGSNKVWLNQKLSLLIYSEHGVDLKPINFFQKLIRFIKNPIYSIIKFFRSINTDKIRTEKLDLIKDFNALYVSKYNSKSIFATKENVSYWELSGQVKSGFILARYKGLVADICHSIDKYNLAHIGTNLFCNTNNSISTSYVGLDFSLSQGESSSIWLDLTSKLRLQGPERECSGTIIDGICPTGCVLNSDVDCCTPDCSCASTTCIGSTCTDPNCGETCQGTLQPDCDPAWQCGDAPNSCGVINECGICGEGYCYSHMCISICTPHIWIDEFTSDFAAGTYNPTLINISGDEIKLIIN